MLPLKWLQWRKIINDCMSSQEVPLPPYLRLPRLACLCFCYFLYLSKTACLSDPLCVHPLSSLSLTGLHSLSICISACLPLLQVNENRVKLGEDVWWITENSCCMTPSVRIGWWAVSGPVHCLAFVHDIISARPGFIMQRLILPD